MPGIYPQKHAVCYPEFESPGPASVGGCSLWYDGLAGLKDFIPKVFPEDAGQETRNSHGSIDHMQSKRHPHLLEASQTGLLVIDVQEKFRPVMQRFDQLVETCKRLVRTFHTLNLPICVTEQYPKGLGRTVPELLEALGTAPVLEKTAFSSCGCPGVTEFFASSGTSTILACGIETHVCVSQSVHDLLEAGYRVHVAPDAVESRRPLDRETAIRKMCSSGAILTTSEMAAFELLGDSRHPRFKEVQALFK